MPTSAYAKLLSGHRLRTSAASGRTIVTESESDRGRVLFCAAFRRLQQKAQVFSMEPNAAVRSRLTHSLEVAQIGRYIADEVGARLTKRSLIQPLERAAMVNFVETACMMHDIGNPPFGHFGEAAIQQWFRDKGAKTIGHAVNLDRGTLGTGDPRLVKALEDFYEFDGNPQGLRVVSKLQWNTDHYGLNLTKTTLASFLKYVRQTGVPPSGLFTKKAGYFSTEATVVKRVWDEFEYSDAQRFPLAYIMEAADDIAYCVSDLEDSFEKGLVHERDAFDAIRKGYGGYLAGTTHAASAPIQQALANVASRKRPDSSEYTYTDFRTSLNRTIVEYVADKYVDMHEQILKGAQDTLLPRNEPPGAILEALKDYCRENVYTHETIQRTELAGYTAIKGLLDHFAILLEASRDRFSAALAHKPKDSNGNPVVIESKLLRLFPEKYIKVYEHETATLPITEHGQFVEWVARAHLVVDFISGMTDDYSMTTYRTLAGMRI